MLDSFGSGSKVGQFVNIEMELRKCCNHPFLIRGVEELECRNRTHDEYISKVLNNNIYKNIEIRLYLATRQLGNCYYDYYFF